MLDNSAPLLLDVTRLIWRRWSRRQPTGVDRVCLAYLKHFRNQAQAVVQHRRIRRVIDRRTSAVLFDLLEDPQQFRSAFIRAALRYGLRRACPGNGRLYLNVGHTGLNVPGFREWVASANVRPIYFVHDLIPITHPEFCRAGEADKHRERMRTVLATGAGVIGNSEATLQDLAAFARSEGLPNVNGVVALLGSDAISPGALKSPDALWATFVVLGTIEARKNHLMLLHVWQRMIAKLGAAAPHLLVVGQRGWEAQAVFDLLDNDLALKSRVTEVGRCNDETLAEHLAGARALLFPSLVEGYGLPLVEALRAGVPVIASDLAVFREIAGHVPEYVDTRDLGAWEQAILAYSKPDSTARLAQMRRITSYTPPTWEDHFATADHWLSEL